MKDFKSGTCHCDTLYALLEADKNGSPARFDKNGLMIDLERLRSGNYLLQCFACFVDLAEPGDPLVKALQEADRFQQILAAFPDDLMWVRTPADIDALLRGGRIGAMLTAEEGGICKDDPAVLRTLYRLGVRMMTLTWNHKNGLAEPTCAPAPAAWPPQPNTTGGLTETGFAFLQEMERLHMIVDVSHLSDAGIWDVLRAGRRPFAASHSSARACCPHPRNLTDEMLAAMGGTRLSGRAQLLPGLPRRFRRPQPSCQPCGRYGPPPAAYDRQRRRRPGGAGAATLTASAARWRSPGRRICPNWPKPCWRPVSARRRSKSCSGATPRASSAKTCKTGGPLHDASQPDLLPAGRGVHRAGRRVPVGKIPHRARRHAPARAHHPLPAPGPKNRRQSGGYCFVVEFTTPDGIRHTAATNDSFWFDQTRRVGTVIEVWYNPASPTVVERRSLEAELLGALFIALGFAVVFWLGLT